MAKDYHGNPGGASLVVRGEEYYEEGAKRVIGMLVVTDMVLVADRHCCTGGPTARLVAGMQVDQGK